MRISREEYLMQEAWNASHRSTCLRLNVGAVLAKYGRVVATGYNGAMAGFPHCQPLTCGPDTPCHNTVHAEANCIYFAARFGIVTFDTTMYSTDSPCIKCAEAIIQAGVTEVVYAREYRDTTPLDFLRQAKIEVRQFSFGDYFAS